MSDGNGDEYRLTAGQLLALHEDHRRGLHVARHADCTDCTLEALRSDFPEPVAAFGPRPDRSAERPALAISYRSAIPETPKAIEVTVNTDPAQRARWDVKKNDYGDLWVFHAHAGGKVPAYVINRWEGDTVARCSECMAYLDLAGTQPAPSNP